jgi:RNA polymerase sigma-70 factor (ECF subfamily)
VIEQSDEVLFAAHVAGDSAAFEVLFARYAPILVRLFRRAVRKPQDAEELVQETFLRAHRGASDFRQGMPLRPWLITIALNLKREYLRRKSRKPEAPLELDGRRDPQTPAHTMDRQDAQKLLQIGLAAIPDAQREVIVLHWFGGVPFPEIASSLGLSVSAVKVRAHRGYKTMRAVLSEQL